jgi:hypothetical protein
VINWQEEYKEETGEEFISLMSPKWDYVRWLQAKLDALQAVNEMLSDIVDRHIHAAK